MPSSPAPWSANQSIGVRGMGRALPGLAISTPALIEMLEQRFGFRHGDRALRLADRLGIMSRHVARPFNERCEQAAEDATNSGLAARAVKAALDDAGLDVADLCYLIGHTTTPDMQLPPNVALAADHLGYAGPHVELRQACTGFANALMIAHGLLATGSGPVAIVGSEVGSLFYDPLSDASDQLVNLVQMGDGAAAIILDAPSKARAAIDACWFGAIGLGQPPSISQRQGAAHFDHDFSNVVERGEALFTASFEHLKSKRLEEASHYIPHQANGRIGSMFAERFPVPQSRVFVQADKVGNTGSAAIWLALEALRHELSSGDTVIALGAEASKYMYGGFVYRHG